MTGDPSPTRTAAPTTTRRRPTSTERWLALVLAPEGDGVRARLGSDVWRVVLSVAGLLVTLFAYHSNAKIQQWFVHLMVPAPSGVTWLITTVAVAGTYGAVGLLLLTSLISRRRPVLIDVLGSGLLAIVIIILWRIVLGVSDGARLTATYPGVNVVIPVASIVITVAMAVSAKPYLARSFQRLIYVAVVLGSIGTVVSGKGLPMSVLASVLVGWGSAAVVRLVTGTPSGLPGADAVAAMLDELGVPVQSVTASPRSNWGAARYDAVGSDGRSLRVSLYGRDASDAALASSLGRSIAYRGTGAPLIASRLQHAEHEAYVTLRAGAVLHGNAPEVVAAGQVGPSRDGIVVTRCPSGRTLGALLDAELPAPPGTAARLLSSVVSLSDESLTHGSIDLDHVVVSDDGDVILDDFLRGTTAATSQWTSRDLASAVVCAALMEGPEAAVTDAVAEAGTERFAGALSYLQAPALPSSLAKAAKAHDGLLDALRADGAERLGVPTPELVKLTRVSIGTLVLALGTLIGGWALLAVLLNVANSFSTIRGANLLWVAVVAVLAALAYPMSALTSEGSIPGTLPFRSLVTLELSNTFSGLAAGTAAVMGARVRFFQKNGYDATSAISSGVIASTASWVVKGALFLIAIPFAVGSFDLETASSTGNETQRAVVLVLIIVCLVGVAAGVVFFVPRVRSALRKLLAPKAAEVRTHLKELAQRPAKLAAVFGGCVGSQLLVAFALGASLHAFDSRLSIAELLVVLTLGSVLGGISPVPGGMGVVEAGMIIGLKAFGIPDDIAVSAVFVQRLWTAYIPPIAGWFALVSLRRHELL